MRWRGKYDLPDRFSTVVPPIVTELAIAVAIIAITMGVWAITMLFSRNLVPFALVFPALTAATLLGGPRSGVLVTVCCQLFAWYFLLPVRNSFLFGSTDDAESLVLTSVVEGLLLWALSLYRRSAYDAARLEAERSADIERSLDSLREKTLLDARLRAQEASFLATKRNLEAIWKSTADGLTLCEAITDDSGSVIDYHVLEVNDAHRELTGATREQMLARPVSLIAQPVDPRWFSSADRVLKTGRMEHFDVRSQATGRWLNIRVSPVSERLFQQTFVDVSDRHLLDEQRRALVNEISHRVMNNFQMIASFLHLQSAGADAGAKMQLDTAAQRIQVMAKLHSLLAYTDGDLSVDFSAFIADLCEQLRAIVDRPEAIKITLETSPLVLDADKVVPLGLILTELVTNAVKYAFPPPAVGTIHIRLSQAGDEWLLAVADDGKGLDDAANTGGGQKSGGLGTRLVATFITQIDGRLVTSTSSGVRHEVFFRP